MSGTLLSVSGHYYPIWQMRILRQRGEHIQESTVEKVPKLGIGSSSFNCIILSLCQVTKLGKIECIGGNLDGGKIIA